jgi:hypothetical protein
VQINFGGREVISPVFPELVIFGIDYGLRCTGLVAGGALALRAIAVLRATRHGLSRFLFGLWGETLVAKVLDSARGSVFKAARIPARSSQVTRVVHMTIEMKETRGVASKSLRISRTEQARQLCSHAWKSLETMTADFPGALVGLGCQTEGNGKINAKIMKTLTKRSF